MPHPPLRLPEVELRAAIYERLRVETRYTIFQRWPNTNLSRFVVLGDVTNEEDSYKDRSNVEVTITIECQAISRTGPRIAAKMLEDVAAALRDTALDLSDDDYDVMALELEFSETRPLPSIDHGYLSVGRFRTEISDTS